MKKRGFREPGIPTGLMPVKDAAKLIAEGQKQTMIKRQFEGVYLTKLDGSKTAFCQTVFKNCRLLGCCFNETEFVDVKFVNCDFNNSGFTDAHFKNCSFESCRAVRADFYGSSINHVSFTDCCITDAGFDAASMSFVRAVNTDFTESSFSKCKLFNVKWENVCFEKANFFKTLLRGVDFSKCRIDEILISDGQGELKGVTVNLDQAVELAKRMGIIIKDTDSDKI